MLTYSVELKPQAEGGYTVTVPVLPRCISESDTVEDALANMPLKVILKQANISVEELTELL